MGRDGNGIPKTPPYIGLARATKSGENTLFLCLTDALIGSQEYEKEREVIELGPNPNQYLLSW